MAYKLVNGKIVNTKKRKVGSGGALGFTVDEATRHIYMIRYAVDDYGNMTEENRTAFYQPAWSDYTVKQWETVRDQFLAKATGTVEEYGTLNKVELHKV